MNDERQITQFPKWFVVFNGGHELNEQGEKIESKRRFLVDWLSPRGFWHCFAFAFDPGADRWLIYEVNRYGTCIVALTSQQFDMWLYIMRHAGARVLEVDVQPAARFWVQFGLWCTVSVRHVLGVRSRALRPICLWRDLLKAGAKEAFV